MSKSIKTVDSNGNIFWKNEHRQLHREDGPAIEFSSGTKYWFVNGKRHRTDGPAVENYDGTKEWWVNDKEIPEWLLNTKIGRLLYG